MEDVTKYETANTLPERRILKASSSTDVQKLSGAIIRWHEKYKGDPIIVRSIGAGAVNQAIKAIIESNNYFGKKGMRVVIAPVFDSFVTPATEVSVERTIVAIELKLELIIIP